MPVPDIRTNIQNIFVYANNAAAGTSTGVRTNATVPVRGRLVEAGFCPNSLVASAMTMAVAIGNQLSSTASSFAQCITSTLGTFSSDNLFEGAVCSVIPPSNTYVQPGDTIQWTTSGGNAAGIGATFYAIIRRG